MYKPIRDYGIIGNLRSAALVSKDGSIDWAPAPFLDSASVFGALLDDRKGGNWSIAPHGSFESEQEYVKETNILVTRFKTSTGVVEVMDCLPIRNGNGISPLKSEEEEILEIHRKVQCTSGECSVRVVFNPKPDFARGEVRLTPVEGGVMMEHEKAKGVCISNARYRSGEEGAVANLRLQEGERHYLTFRYNTTEVPSREDEYYEGDMETTRKYWENWVHRCDLEVCPIEYPWHESVMRSSLVLKILFMEPPGSIAAAATTSLPEEIGSGRNWDYRVSWLRDSAFTLQALFWLGYIKEADEYVRWLVAQCRGADHGGPENLQPMYGLRGQKELAEEELPHLEGYRGSKPVRIGNSAYTQKQWDIYGGLLNMVWRLHRMRNDYEISPEVWEVLRSFVDYVVEIWREPDEGLWEVRGERRHFVHSKVMCWVALDRGIKLAEIYKLEADLATWKRERETVRGAVLQEGWSEKKQSFVQSFGSEKLDTAVLLLPILGFIDGRDERMLKTIKAIEQELSMGEGLLRRYTDSPDDGMPGGEGALMLSSFWLVDALLFSGQKHRAQLLFERLLEYANHVGLYAEEVDPGTGDFLGNFPQAYTHIGLVNSAFYLSFSEETLKQVAS